MFLRQTEKQSLKETEGIKKNKMETLEVKITEILKSQK